MKNPDPRSIAADGRAYIPRSRSDDDLFFVLSLLLLLLFLEDERHTRDDEDVRRRWWNSNLSLNGIAGLSIPILRLQKFELLPMSTMQRYDNAGVVDGDGDDDVVPA